MSFNIMMVNDRFTTLINNKSYTVNHDHPNFDALLQCVRDEDAEGFVNLFTVEKAVTKKYENTAVELRDGVVYYNGEAVHSALTKRIVAFSRDDLPVEPMLNFLANLMQNPSRRAVNELYGFLEHRNMPITDDGCFLAYKAVQENYLDKFSGTFDNSVGKVMEMARNEVDDDCGKTCSVGFHVGALEYAGPGGTFHSYSDKVMIVKVNPRDAVSVPVDHSAQKLRVCRYEVVGEYDKPLDDDYDNSYDEVEEVEEKEESKLFHTLTPVYPNDRTDVNNDNSEHIEYSKFKELCDKASTIGTLGSTPAAFTNLVRDLGTVTKEYSHSIREPNTSPGWGRNIYTSRFVDTYRRKIKSRRRPPKLAGGLRALEVSMLICYNTDGSLRWINIKDYDRSEFIRLTEAY